MPAYAQGTTGIPLQAIYPGGIGAIVWVNENPATGTKSLAVNVAGFGADGSTQSLSFEVKFAGAPGAFEIDIQDADTDEDAAYSSIPNAKLTTVNAGNYARFEFAPFRGRFVRAIMVAQNANSVNIVAAKFTR